MDGDHARLVRHVYTLHGESGVVVGDRAHKEDQDVLVELLRFPETAFREDFQLLLS